VITISFTEEENQQNEMTLMNRLLMFRNNHEPEKLTVNNTQWECIITEPKKEKVLLLPGGSGIGESWFLHIEKMKDKYQLIAPTYPPVDTMEKLVEGIIGLLEEKQIEKVHVIGQSFGGLVAQCLVEKYSKRVWKLILSHTTSSPVGELKEERKKRIAGLKKRLLLYQLLPKCFTNFFVKKKLPKMFQQFENKNEAEFWCEYLLDITTNKTPKKTSIKMLKCMLDFAENYQFKKEDFKSIQERTLILDSLSDKAFGQEEREVVKELFPKAETFQFKSSTGHLSLFIDRKIAFKVISEFLE
jgi:hypothetical protein